MSNQKTVVLVRHAYAEYAQDEHRKLSPKGQQDSERLCRALSALEITSIYASPYQRAVSTVLPLARMLSLPVHLRPGLRERKLSAVSVADFQSATKSSWENMACSFPGGESNLNAQQRAFAVLRNVCAEPGISVVATHGTLLALMLNALDPHIGYAFWKSMRMPEALLVVVQLSHRHIHLRNYRKVAWES